MTGDSALANSKALLAGSRLRQSQDGLGSADSKRSRPDRRAQLGAVSDSVRVALTQWLPFGETRSARVLDWPVPDAVRQDFSSLLAVNRSQARSYGKKRKMARNAEAKKALFTFCNIWANSAKAVPKLFGFSQLALI